MNITPEWLAGFFDGEGCICAHMHGTTINVGVSLTNCNLEIMMAIAGMFPNAHLQDKAKYESRRSCIRLGWTGTGARKLLLYIVPHLRLKKAQAEAALNIIELIDKRISTGREEFANVIKLANNRG